MHMTKIILGAFVIVGLTGCATQTAQTTMPDTRAKDVADIKALEDRYVAAFNAKDVDAIMAAYGPEEALFVFDVIPPLQYNGVRMYRKTYEDFLALFPGEFHVSISDLDITVSASGDVAYGHSLQHVKGVRKNGKKTDGILRVTNGYRKVNGQWLIAQEHNSIPPTRGLN